MNPTSNHVAKPFDLINHPPEPGSLSDSDSFHAEGCLPHLGVLLIEGRDAANFLQSQLTSDVMALQAPGDAQWTGYCNPKGRLYLTGWLAKTAENESAYALIIDRSLSASMLKRLRMFVLRAKLSIDEAAEPLHIYGQIGTALTLPQDALQLRIPSATIKAGTSIQRSLYWLKARDPGEGLTPTWHWLQLLSAEAWIDATVSERFVPQMLNFERIGGVNFKKGCYPGQEVVARSQYLGKLKRRSFLYRVDDPKQSLPEPGQALGEASNPELNIVSLARCPGTSGQSLWELATTDAQTRQSCPLALILAEGRTDSASGLLGQPLPLPYALQDES